VKSSFKLSVVEKRKRGPGRPKQEEGSGLAEVEDVTPEMDDDSESVLDSDGFSADAGGRRRRGVPSDRDDADLPDEPPPGYFE